MTATTKQRWYAITNDLHNLRRDALAALEIGDSPDVMEAWVTVKRVEIQLLQLSLREQERL